METIEISNELWVDISTTPPDSVFVTLRDSVGGMVYVEMSEIPRLIEVLATFEKKEGQSEATNPFR